MKKNWEKPVIKELNIEESKGGFFPGANENSYIITSITEEGSTSGSWGEDSTTS